MNEQFLGKIEDRELKEKVKVIDLPDDFKSKKIKPDHDYKKIYRGEQEDRLKEKVKHYFPKFQVGMAGDHLCFYVKQRSSLELYYINKYIEDIDKWNDLLRKHQKNEFILKEFVNSFEGKMVMMSEYKIHFQVKDEFKPYFIDKLCYLLSHDKELIDLVLAFKIRTKYDKQQPNYPEAVIYIHPDPLELDKREKETRYREINEQFVEKTLGVSRKKFEKALAKLWFYFKNDAQILGTGNLPRHNIQIDTSNSLIFVAQSGGDTKENLGSSINKYYDGQYNYSFRIGEKPPKAEELEKMIQKQ